MSEKSAFPNVKRKERINYFALVRSSLDLPTKKSASAISPAFHNRHQLRLKNMQVFASCDKECTSFAKERAVLVMVSECDSGHSRVQLLKKEAAH